MLDALKKGALVSDGPIEFKPTQMLTKREYFAALCMHSLIQYESLDWVEIAKEAVTGADALIEELDRQE